MSRKKNNLQILFARKAEKIVVAELDLLKFRVEHPELNTSNIPTVQWTAGIADFVEFVYAAHAGNVLNNGETEIKAIAEPLAKMFNIELKDFYGTYLGIRRRKKNRTVFLDSLRTTLNRKMDEADERERVRNRK